MHHLSLDMLKMAFCELKANAASGIDKITWHDYKEKLDENLSSLLARIKSDAFRATPVRRQFIPKSSGGKRPLGICIVEDKIVQGAIKLILESIYDPLFLPQSYGFRPNTRAHDALDALYMGIYDFKSKVHFILDADIKACFDNIDQNLLKSILSLKIGDKRMIRLIDRLLKAGVYDHGTVHKSEKGVVQGSVLSPLLANIFLDWVLDRFVVWWRTNMAKGQIIYTR